MFLVYVWKFG